jgi:hypothetical protein
MATDWTKIGLVPTTDMIAWHAYDSATSTAGNINDLSGNARHIVQASTPPALQTDVLNGQPAWYFNGTTSNPLQTASSSAVAPKHVFILASFEDDAFDAERGLISGKTSGLLLDSEASGTEWDDVGNDGYQKSGTTPSPALSAAMGGDAELMEVTDAGGVSIDGISIGQKLADTATRWKGWFFDHISYSSIQTGDNLKRIYLYYAMRYAQHRRVPFYFPDDDLISHPRLRFNEIEKGWDEVTDSYQFEDGGRTFNTVASNSPRRWEYEYNIWHTGVNTASRDPELHDLFREFWNTAQLAYPFYFRDKYGETHSDVRIQSYSNTSDAHKAWIRRVRFELVQYP